MSEFSRRGIVANAVRIRAAAAARKENRRPSLSICLNYLEKKRDVRRLPKPASDGWDPTTTGPASLGQRAAIF
jgi:hypothetical protein